MPSADHRPTDPGTITAWRRWPLLRGPDPPPPARRTRHLGHGLVALWCSVVAVTGTACADAPSSSRPDGRTSGAAASAAVTPTGARARSAGASAPGGSAPATTAPGTAPGTTARSLDAASATPSGFSRLPSASGRLLQTVLGGPASGVRMKVWVWLPPQYDDPAYADRSFPALMLYPGGSGAGYNTWAGTQYGAQALVADGARAGSVTPFVFVMPAMQRSEQQDTECADLPGQPRVGTFLGVDVRQLIESTFRVRRDRTGWGAVGASAGAYCALRIAFNHPDQYAAAVSIDGYFALQTPLPHVATPAVLAQDPAALAADRPPDVSVLVWSGDKKGPDLARARAFVASARPPTRIELRLLSRGRHTTRDFARMMPDTLAFLTRELAGPQPTRATPG